ncbi:MAG: hypothetical protein KAT62_10915 [Desulfuromonadales bacterium]|nr:hypothetical protein [Desulfuromonadales bacterium]
MTLQNLLAIGQLKEHEASAEEVRALLVAVRRNLADAQVTAVSLETRFDAGYKAIMQLAMVALLANGFRPGSGVGHHMTMIQTLPKSVGLARQRVVILDALRRKRNAADYMGSYVDQSATDTCIAEAQALLRDVESWLGEHRPDLL